MEKIINKYGSIYYHTGINLTIAGFNNLIKELYRGEKWIGGIFPPGWTEKTHLCVDHGPVHLFLIDMKEPSQTVALKDECRRIFNRGKHSLHMSDETVDTFRISSSLLNENSIHFLNNGTNDLKNNTKELLKIYFEHIGNDENYCIMSNILEDLEYIKYIHISDKIIDKPFFKLIHIEHSKDEIIFNPTNHFYFNGIKVINSLK